MPAADVADRVRDVVVTYLPDAAPSFQPAQGGLVNLPTIFAAGEPESVTTEPFQVLGFTVVVTATAHWDWTFDRGVEQGFDKPGGAYPNDDVSYTYASAGDRDVSLTTTWDATFTIDGGGPYTVPAPAITKTVGPDPGAGPRSPLRPRRRLAQRILRRHAVVDPACRLKIRR